jgi:hypothetical protein
MGFIQRARIPDQVAEAGFCVCSYVVVVFFPDSQLKVAENTTVSLQKFNQRWKFVAAHTSTAEKCDA